MMKKWVCSVLAVLFLVSMLASCGGGTSISIAYVRLANQVTNLFIENSGIASLTETVTYLNRDGSENYTYTLYYERAEDIYAGYNLCEIAGEYRLYAYEGAVYTDEGDGVCAVLLLVGSYTDYIGDYLNGEFPLDGDILNQRSSKRDGEAIIAEYRSAITPQRAAALSAFGITDRDTVISCYTVMDGFITSIEYFIETESETYPFAVRRFEKSETKANHFSDVSGFVPWISVDIVFPNSEEQGRHFTVPSGVMVGIDDGNRGYSFFRDEECTIPYSYRDGVITESLVLYVKN